MIITLKSTDSTNSYVLRNFETLNDKTLIIALKQSNGRGRHGRLWVSPPYKNLYASFILKNEKLHIPSMSRIASLAVLHTLRDFSSEPEFKIKWPNDIYAKTQNCEFRKISGILCEMHTPLNSNQFDGCVIGIGVNLNMNKEEIRKIPAPASSVKLLTGRDTDIAKFAEALLLHLQDYSDYIPEKLLELSKNEDMLSDKIITIISEDKTSFTGIVKEIKLDGGICIQSEDGQFRVFHSGRILIPIERP